MNRGRRAALRWGAAAALGCALAARARAEEAPATLAVEGFDLDGHDAARDREVPVRLYLPALPRPVPLVLFSHGIGGSRFGYSWFGRHMAEQGIASLHVQHVGSDRQLWSGSALGLVGRLQAAAQEKEAVARVHDLRFALDSLLAGPLAARIDAKRLLAAGHSYGANTTLLATGARVPREGGALQLRDERLRAAIVMSAPPFYGEGDPRPILQHVQVPSLHVTCTDDVIRIPGYWSGAQDRIEVFEATGSARKWLAVYEGGSHSMFTDRRNTGGATLNPQVKAATQALALAFVRQVFEGEAAALAAWPKQHAALLARFAAQPPLATA